MSCLQDSCERMQQIIVHHETMYLINHLPSSPACLIYISVNVGPFPWHLNVFKRRSTSLTHVRPVLWANLLQHEPKAPSINET